MVDHHLTLSTLYKLMVMAQEEVEAAKVGINNSRERLNKAKTAYQKRLAAVRADILRNFQGVELPQWAQSVRDGADWNFTRKETDYGCSDDDSNRDHRGSLPDSDSVG